MEKIVRLRDEDNVVVANSALEEGTTLGASYCGTPFPQGIKSHHVISPWGRAF